jgi:hypothetical protein
MRSLGVVLKPIFGGWIVELTDGREVARFIGPAAQRRALRYLASNGIVSDADRADEGLIRQGCATAGLKSRVPR